MSTLLIEELQNFLETEFMTKVCYILKHTDYLNQQEKYIITQLFKNKYTTELVDLNDAPNKHNRQHILEYILSGKTTEITPRFCEQFLQEKLRSQQ